MKNIKKPDIILKLAMSCDGFLDNEKREIFSNQKDYLSVQKIRSNVDAILIGANTLRKDNPSLLVNGQIKQPLRVILLGKKDFPLDSKILNDEAGEVLVFVHEGINLPNVFSKYVMFVKYQEDIFPLDTLCKILYERGIKSMLVEGGANLALQFLEQDLADILRIAYSPKIIANENATKLRIKEDKYLKESKLKIEDLGNMYAAWYFLHDDSTFSSIFKNNNF